MKSITHQISVGCGNMYMTIDKDGDKIVRISCNLGKSGSCLSFWSNTISHLVNLCIKNGTDIKEIINQLKGEEDNGDIVKCPNPTIKYNSCMDAIARVLEEVIQEK